MQTPRLARRPEIGGYATEKVHVPVSAQQSALRERRLAVASQSQ
jgi:hypothetical protein